MKYLLTEAGKTYWERMDILRKRTEKPRVIKPLNISRENMIQFFSPKSHRVKPKLVQRELTFEEKKKTLLQRVSAWVQPSGPRVKVPREMTTDQRERAYKRFKRTALAEGSRSIKRLIRKMKAGHIPKDSESVRQKIKDTEDRYAQAQAGVDPDTRPKNVRGILAGVAKGQEDTGRPPSQYQARTEAEIDQAADTRMAPVVRSIKRAHSRGIGTFEPGKDQPGTVTALAKQRKEDPTLDRNISQKAAMYRAIRRRRVPPSMN